MSTDPFAPNPQDQQPPTASVAVIERPTQAASDDDAYMQTIVENIAAKASHGGLLEDDENIYSVLYESDERQISELLRAGYTTAAGHPQVSKSDGRIVLKLSKEIHNERYQTQAYQAARKLKRVADEGGNVSPENVLGQKAQLKTEQAITDVLQRMPESDRDAERAQIRNINPNINFDDDDQ